MPPSPIRSRMMYEPNRWTFEDALIPKKPAAAYTCRWDHSLGILLVSQSLERLDRSPMMRTGSLLLGFALFVCACSSDNKRDTGIITDPDASDATDADEGDALPRSEEHTSELQ